MTDLRERPDESRSIEAAREAAERYSPVRGQGGLNWYRREAFKAGAEWGIAATGERVEALVVLIERYFDTTASETEVRAALRALESLGAPISNEIPTTEGGSQ